MSLRAVIWAQSFVECDVKAKAVLSALARSATVRGAARFLSVACLERRTGLSDRGVRRAMSYLEREGLVSRRIQSGRQGVNSYVIVGAPAWVWDHAIPIPKEDGADADDENPDGVTGISPYKPGHGVRGADTMTGNPDTVTVNPDTMTVNPDAMTDRGSMGTKGGSGGGSSAGADDAEPHTCAEVAPRWALRSPAGAGGFVASDPARPWRYDPASDATSWEKVCRSHGLATFNGMAEEWAELVQASDVQTWGEAGEALAMFAHLFQKENGPQAKQIRPGQVGGFVSEVRKRINARRREAAMIAAALPRRDAEPAPEVRAVSARSSQEDPAMVEEREAAHASPLGRQWADVVAALARSARDDGDARAIALWLATRKVYPVALEGSTLLLRVPTVLFASTLADRFAIRICAVTGWDIECLTPGTAVKASTC